MEKKNYDEIMSLLPQKIREEIISVKSFIKTLNNIKLKQKIIISDNDYPYQIAFTSDYGFSYNIIIRKDIGEIKNKIYLIAYNAHSQQRKFGVRKKNYFVEALEKISETDKNLADELFGRIKSCGKDCYAKGSGCLHGVVLSYRNSIKCTCAGSFNLGSAEEDFATVKILLKAMNDVYCTPTEEKSSEISNIINIINIIYKLPLDADKWQSECKDSKDGKDGLCDYNNLGAFTDIQSDKHGLTIRPSAIAPDWRPYASCFPENIYLDAAETNIYFDFTAETKWLIKLTLSDGSKKQVIDFQSAIGSVPVGHDGCAGRHCGYVRLIDLLPKEEVNTANKFKLERVDISSTWLITASRIDIKSFVFGR